MNDPDLAELGPGSAPGGLYRAMCLIATTIAVVLFLVLALMPGVIYWLFEIPAHETANFLGRRAAMMFAGFAVLGFLGGTARSPETRLIVALSIGVAMFALGLLGLYEFARGFAGPGILIAVVIEFAICIGFLWAIRHET